jgi:hypothetical protein
LLHFQRQAPERLSIAAGQLRVLDPLG